MNDGSVSCKTILVIEDDESIRDALSEALECEGYRVKTAVDGREGLALLRNSEQPCLVLLDMMMPVMNGRQFLDEMMKDSVLAPIPVFVVSAIADRKNTVGARGFIKKPADLNVVLQMVGQYCGKPAA